MPDVAAFDFDGTVIRRGSVFGFLGAVSGRRGALLAAAGIFPRLVHAAVVGGEAADRTKERLFERTLAGVEPGHLDRVAHVYTERLLDRVRPDIAARVDWHRGRGDAVLLVSASPEVYVGLVARRLGADGAIATRLAVGDDGRLTGHYDGANCRGPEKIRRLRRWIERSGMTAPESLGLREQPRRSVDARSRRRRRQRGTSGALRTAPTVSVAPAHSARGRAVETRVAESEDAAVARHHPVAAAIGSAGHPDRRSDQMERPGRTVEDRAAEGEDAAVGGDQQ